MKKYILIAEDDLDDQEFLLHAIQSAGLPLKPSFVRDGQELVKYLQANSEELPALLLLDISMPGKNGYAVLKELKTHATFSNIPVIMLTSASPNIAKSICKELGAVDFFSKPDTPKGWYRIAERLQGILDG